MLTPALAEDQSMGQGTQELQRQANQEAQMMNNMAKQLLKVSRLTARLAAVSWDCYMMKLDMEIMTLMDAAQADYERTTQDMTGEDRYKMGPQHIYVWDAAMVWLLQTLKAEGTSAEARAHIPTLETYSSAMAKMGPNELAQEVRECKVKKGFHKGTIRLEIAVLVTTTSYNVHHAILRPMLLSLRGARQTRGSEPKGDLERKFQAALPEPASGSKKD